MDEKTRNLMCSSKSKEWFTPKPIFDKLNAEFHFTTDICTSAANPVGCPIFFTKEQDGLKNLDKWQGNVFCNPPYGREVDIWVTKCAQYAKSGRGTAVMLIAARTDTERFHKYIWDKEKHNPYPGVEVRFLQNRIKFLNSQGKAEDPAGFPSMVVVFYSYPHTVSEEEEWKKED